MYILFISMTDVKGVNRGIDFYLLMLLRISISKIIIIIFCIPVSFGFGSSIYGSLIKNCLHFTWILCHGVQTCVAWVTIFLLWCAWATVLVKPNASSIGICGGEYLMRGVCGKVKQAGNNTNRLGIIWTRWGEVKQGGIKWWSVPYRHNEKSIFLIIIVFHPKLLDAGQWWMGQK